MKRLAILTSALVATLASTPVGNAAEPTVLRWAYTAPLTSPTYTRFWGPWLKKVNEDAKGVFHVDVFAGSRLASLTNVYDRLVQNVYELGYGIHGAIAGKFPKTEVCILPFLASDPEIASGALWNLYQSGVISNEYTDTKPIALFVYSQNNFHLKKPVRKLEDMSGLKVGVSARISGELVQALGAQPVSVPVTEYYQAANRGLIDGILVGWTGVLQFKVQEVTNYHLEASFGTGSGFFLMNKNAYARLPDKGRAIIDHHSGLATSMGFGKVLRGIADYQRSTVAKMPHHTIAQLSPSEQKRWEERVKPIISQWEKATPNGAEILAAYRSEIAKLSAANK